MLLCVVMLLLCTILGRPRVWIVGATNNNREVKIYVNVFVRDKNTWSKQGDTINISVTQTAYKLVPFLVVIGSLDDSDGKNVLVSIQLDAMNNWNVRNTFKSNLGFSVAMEAAGDRLLMDITGGIRIAYLTNSDFSPDSTGWQNVVVLNHEKFLELRNSYKIFVFKSRRYITTSDSSFFHMAVFIIIDRVSMD